MVQEGKTVLVLGGGVGGLVTVNELRKQLSQPHRVVRGRAFDHAPVLALSALADDWPAQAPGH